MVRTYSFENTIVTISHPDVGQYTMYGAGLGDITISRSNDETSHEISADLSVLISKSVKKNGTVIKKIKLDKSDREMVDIVLKNNLGVVELVSDDKHNYKYEVELDEINLPINSGSVVGKINVLENGKVVSTGDLVINKNAKKLSVLELFYNSIKSICNGNI